jgi:hypothetical protein
MKTTSTNTEEGWLAVSTEGFAQQNAARPPEHLVKELVQNALDALPKEGGTISLWCEPEETNPQQMWIHCEDSGSGIEDMENLRTVFWTNKQDSHLKRGRMGRGFKEMLCLATHAEVVSGKVVAAFATTTAKRKVFSIHPATSERKGSRITMRMPWPLEETRTALNAYFQTFLPPPNTQLTINGTEISHKTPTHSIQATLTTEAFQNGRWIKPSTKTEIQLVPTHNGDPGWIYEMGIPVCPVEWDRPYNANIQQRVPMNPNRDAVMSGYPAKIHRACLPTLLKELGEEEAKAAWVGEAAAKSKDEILQKEVLRKAFGENLARSVPKFGKFDHDADAEEQASATILDTKQLSGGFRELARAHLPTSKEVANAAMEESKKEAAERGSRPDDHTKNSALIEKIGRSRVKAVCAFNKWLADEILKIIAGPDAPTCVVHVANMEGKYIATWSQEFQIYTLALEHNPTWEKPTSPESLATIVHETAHELAAHHGKSFATAMEETAGAALATILNKKKEVDQWRKKLESL